MSLVDFAGMFKNEPGNSFLSNRHFPSYLNYTGNPNPTMVDDFLQATKPVSNAEAINNYNNSLAGRLGAFGNFFNSSAGKGLIGVGGLVGGLMDAFTNYGAYKQNKKNAALQREIAGYNLDRMKQENNRLDRQRADITNSWKNGSVI